MFVIAETCLDIWILIEYEQLKYYQPSLNKANVHAAFCDNIDTRTVLEALKELITQSNSYIEVITQLPRMDTGLNWLIIVLNFNFEFYVRNIIVQINLWAKNYIYIYIFF